MIIRSIFEHSKLKQMNNNNKWMKQEEEEKQKNEDLTPEMRQLRQYEEDMRRIREQRPKMEIDAKLKAGADLTPDEIEYLKKNDPEAYKEYEEIRREAENYKKQLKNCKTKKDVERLKMNKMGQFMAEAKSVSQNPNIPKAKKLGMMEKILKKTMAVQKEHIEFTKSLLYQSLPTEEEESERKAKQKEAAQEEAVQEETVQEETVQKEAIQEVKAGDENKAVSKTDMSEILNISNIPKMPKISEIKKTGSRQKVEKEHHQKTAGFEETRAVIMEEITSFSRIRSTVRKE